MSAGKDGKIDGEPPMSPGLKMEENGASNVSKGPAPAEGPVGVSGAEGVLAPVPGADDFGRGEGENCVIQQSFPIPVHKIGWIIGKRGSYVKQLQQKSGATIVVSNTTSKEYGQVWKYLQIVGTGRSIDRAKKLLHIRLERLELDTMDGGVHMVAIAGGGDNVSGVNDG